jgi:glucose/arabinose dehydrogenase
MLKRMIVCVVVAACFATGAALAQTDSTKTQAPAAQPAAPAAQPAAPAEPAAHAAAPAMSPADTVTYASARIMFHEAATANGAVSFHFGPAGMKPDVVTVTVLAKTKAKDVAKDAEKEFKVTAGSAYKVERKGDELDIKTAKKGGTRFHLSVNQNTANGVSVGIK